jgi:hypothetical protein
MVDACFYIYIEATLIAILINSRGLRRLSILQPTKASMIAPGKAVELGEPFLLKMLYDPKDFPDLT